ncbi:hypothetical protein Avbf_07697 [Armadillidium vulgare]|nr:hypothetical protein Avbf_07697 [Armadillidium vulgare]
MSTEEPFKSGESIIDQNTRQATSLFPSHIKILLRLRVKRLSLQGSLVRSEVLQCENASHLDLLILSFSGNGDTEAKLQNFMSTATHLTHLECHDFCTDSMLKVISSSCHNLYSLNLHGCNVTDEGILNLCGLTQNLVQCINLLSNGQRIIPKSRCFFSLKKIELKFMTKVTEAGVAIILLLLTNINVLRVPDIRMEKLFWFLSSVDHKGVQSNLKQFHSGEILDEDQLSVLTRLCPNLEDIQMSYVGNFDIDLIRLHKLTSLQRLSEAEFADANTDALMIYLSEIGSQLNYLKLYIRRTKFSQEQLKIAQSHLRNLARLCPNVSHLSLDGYSLDEDSSLVRNNENSYHFFQSLHTLKLLNMKLSVEDLKLFLCKCTNMKDLELRLKDPHVLNDYFINDLLKEEVWKNLKILNIANSHITFKMMMRLINECPNLVSLGSVTTWHITRDQMMACKEMARKRNLNIEIS